MKYTKRILIVIIALIIIGVSTIVAPWALLFFGILMMPPPPKPEIKSHEFAFSLTYELNGEMKAIDDIAICEFDGYGNRSTAGQSRKYKTRLKSGMDEQIVKENDTAIVWVTLLDQRQSEDYDWSGNKILELYFFGGDAHYYMGDELGNHNRDEQDFDYIGYIYQKPDGTIANGSFTADDAWEKYKIKLIDWECETPIVNSFEGGWFHKLLEGEWISTK